MWSPAWLLAGEVPGGAWGRLLALRRSAQVEREVPALGKDFAATSAQHLMTAASLVMEAAWEFFLETRIWLTVSDIRTRPESLSWREGEEEHGGQGVLQEGSEVLSLDAGEKVERSIHLFAELAFCCGCKFKFL